MGATCPGARANHLTPSVGPPTCCIMVVCIHKTWAWCPLGVHDQNSARCGHVTGYMTWGWPHYKHLGLSPLLLYVGGCIGHMWLDVCPLRSSPVVFCYGSGVVSWCGCWDYGLELSPSPRLPLPCSCGVVCDHRLGLSPGPFPICTSLHL